MVTPQEPKQFDKTLEQIIPENQNAPFNMKDLINRVIDEGSFYEVKKLFAQELITGLARIDGKPVGIIANQPRMKGGDYSMIQLIKLLSLLIYVMHIIFHYYSLRMYQDL